MVSNYFTVMCYSEVAGDHYNVGVIENSVNIGEIMEIMNCAPQWCGFHALVQGK